ncbi:MAG: oligosaccharide flippase family protein [Gammaproteobacteria bacterium]|nr:oligosaccharide flippase family protein [Gammaproteobacteria bacterium]
MTGILIQAVLIVSGILAARFLGVEGRGYLALLVLFAVTVSQLGLLGLPQAVTHFVARDHSIAPRMMTLCGRAVLSQSVLLFGTHAGVLAIYLQDKSDDVVLAGLITLSAVPGFVAQQYGLAILQGMGHFRSFNAIRLADPVLYSVGMASLWVSGHVSLPLVTIMWGAAKVVVGFFAFRRARVTVSLQGSMARGRSLPETRRLLTYGLRGMVGYVSPLESLKFDQLVAGLYLSPAALGIYVVAQAFNNLPKFVAHSLGMVVFPFMSAVESARAAKSYLGIFSSSVVVLNGVLIVALYYLMPWLVVTFFGAEFSDAIPVARMLLAAALLWSIRRILVECQRGLGYPESSTYAELAMYPVLLMTLPFLVPKLGLEGLALSIVIAQAASLITALLFNGLTVIRVRSDESG